MSGNDSLVGSTVGNYRVTGILGEGGMGRVYRAEHPEIGRQVAIKVVASHYSAMPAVVQRFKAEALAVNRIGHPNIVDISDFGALGDGRPYFIMECLEGETLGRRMQRLGPADGETVAPILRQTLDALAAAHAVHIIHRDLKPDNIFVARRRDGQELVKLLDFGIAKLRADAGAGANATADGTLLGTPTYMSPEQALGRMKEIGPPSDVYSFGIILYQMFTGTTPFVSDQLGPLLVAHVHETPPPPRQHRPDLDPRLEAVILRCLQKDPAARYASAAELSAALREVLPAMVGAATIFEQRTPIHDESVAVASNAAASNALASNVASSNAAASSVAGAAAPARARRDLAPIALAVALVLAALVGGLALLRTRGPAPLPASAIAPPAPGPLLDGRELPAPPVSAR